MHTSYLYDSKTDTRRARLTDISTPLVHRTRLIIRAERGQGPVLLNRTYTTHAGARSALNRRGAWDRVSKHMY